MTSSLTSISHSCTLSELTVENSRPVYFAGTLGYFFFPQKACGGDKISCISNKTESTVSWKTSCYCVSNKRPAWLATAGTRWSLVTLNVTSFLTETIGYVGYYHIHLPGALSEDRFVISFESRGAGTSCYRIRPSSCFKPGFARRCSTQQIFPRRTPSIGAQRKRKSL